MSFAKATQLLRIADLAAARYDGVTLEEIAQEFSCSHRTAQRMMQAFEEVFPATMVTDSSTDRRRRWRLPRVDPRWLHAQSIRETELVALDLAIRRLAQDGLDEQARSLQRLRERILSALPSPFVRKAEADAEALLEAQGFASRPGPRTAADPDLLGAITEALRQPCEIRITYRTADGAAQVRLVEPHGLLLGTRRYLVARPADGDGLMRRFRLDRIETAEITGRVFARDPDFDLDRFSAQAFGSYHTASEYGPVAWRFSPEAADAARQFVFHPDQELTEEPDGSLTVRFTAAGQLEMAWHLYQWGDLVEVLEPAELRELVALHRRQDFPALP